MNLKTFIVCLYEDKALNVAKDIIKTNDELSIIPRFTTNTEYKNEVNENYVYYLDVNTLQITAALGLDGDMSINGGSLGNVLTQYTSSFGVRFPLSGTAANQMILNVVQQVAGVVSGAAALVGGVATGNVAAIAGGAATSAGALLSGGQTAPITYGSVSPMSGLYAPQIPYLIINRPISAEPSSWAADMGYSAGYSGKVSSFTGYLEALHVELNRAPNMTEQEAKEIISALQGGILI